MKLFFAILVPALASAAIWPDAIGPYKKTGAPDFVAADKAVWDEYGLKTAELAVYSQGARKFNAAAYQLRDSTAALAAFDWQRDPKSTPSKIAPLAAETGDSLTVAHGNYLFSFAGYKPDVAELGTVFSGLREVDGAPLPTLPGFMPSANLIPNSERFISGPMSLQKFFPGVPPSVAAFRMGAEAEAAVFTTPKGDMPLAIFNYPTNQIAQLQVVEFGKIPGAVVKRSGPLVAVIVAPPDPDAAERVLAQVRYEAAITLDEYVPTRRDNIGDLILNAFVLIGILGAFCIVSGLFVGGFRAFLLRGKKGDERDPMILLHLERH